MTHNQNLNEIFANVERAIRQRIEELRLNFDNMEGVMTFIDTNYDITARNIIRQNHLDPDDPGIIPQIERNKTALMEKIRQEHS